MQYINPIEILGLSNVTDKTNIDNETIKKAKRKLFADIDLSDNGLFEYYGLKITKGDCEKVIDELSNEDFKEFYLYLSSNKNLNAFLVNGKIESLKNFKQDSIFKLPEFVKFVSPYFAPKFDKALLIAFEKEDIEQTKIILNTSNLISQVDVNSAYKSVSNNIQNKIIEIDEIKKDIKNENSVYNENNIKDVVVTVKEHFPAKTLNCLPQYFQSQILKIAYSINYLQLEIGYAFDDTKVKLDLLEYLLTLNIDGLDKPIFEDNYKIVKERNDERIEQIKNAPLLKKWAEILLQIKDSINAVENNTINSNLVFENLKKSFSVSELNNLPSFANEIRSQIGYSIRSLSIAMWNKQNDIRSALNTINIALEINIDDEAKLKFEQDKTELNRLEKENKGILICHFCDKNVPEKKAGFTKKIYQENYRNTSGRTTSVSFRTADVFIPRCKSCNKNHSIGWTIYYIVFLLIFCGLFWFVSNEDLPNDGYVFMWILVISWIVSKLVITFYYKKQEIKNSSELILKKHPLFVNEIDYGWSFYEPSASTFLMILGLIGHGYDFVNKVTVNLIDKMYSKINF